MNKLLVISPHFDDAVLSIGQFMAERPDCEVVTIFAGVPDEPDTVHTPYDKKCGFDNARNAVGARIRENDEATALLNATTINLDFPDGQYGIEVSEERITEVLQRIVDGREYDGIYAPIGLGHPDHIKVANAVLAIETNLPVTLWEDVPIRITEPQLVPDRLKELGIKYWPTRSIFNRMYIADKVRALSCYKSQIGTGILDPYLMYVPERFYNVK